MIHLSGSIKKAKSIDEAVEIINSRAPCESIEGVSFTPEQLAGQYACKANEDSDAELHKDELEVHLSILSEAGARFDSYTALKHACRLAEESFRKEANTYDCEDWRELYREWVGEVCDTGAMTDDKIDHEVEEVFKHSWIEYEVVSRFE